MDSGDVTLVMRAFDGPSWDESACRGESLPVTHHIRPPPSPPEDTSDLLPFHVNCLPVPPWPRPQLNAVQNGSFEDPSLAGWQIQTCYDPPGPKGGPAADGTNSVGVCGGFFQYVETVPGQRYRLQFALIRGYSPAFEVDWNGQALPLDLGDQPWYDWRYRDYLVIADCTSTRLQFTEGPDAGEHFIDDVSLEPLPERPLPSSLTLRHNRVLDSPPLVIRRLFYAHATYVALAQAEYPGTNQIKVFTSTTGTNWQESFSQSATPPKTVRSLTYGIDRDLFVAVGNQMNLTSQDGAIWLSQSYPPAADLHAVAYARPYGRGLFIAVGAGLNSPDEGVVFTTRSGVLWDQGTLPTGTPALNGIHLLWQRPVHRRWRWWHHHGLIRRILVDGSNKPGLPITPGRGVRCGHVFCGGD
jgi:hypothetical protein